MVDVSITAKEVRGICSAGIRVGDRIVMRGAGISLAETDCICGMAFASIYPIVFAARLGNDLKDLGLIERQVRCIDPGQPASQGGSVLFEIKALE